MNEPAGFHVHVDLPPPDWNDYVAGHPNARAYHVATWAITVSKLFDLPVYFISARNTDGRLTGILPLVRQRSWLFGDRLVSLPYFNYGGALADDAVTHAGLLEFAADLAKELRVDQIEIREAQSPPVAWPQRSDKATLLLDLPPSVEGLNRQLGSKLRSQVKRALREEPKAIFGERELLDDFYGVFAEVMRDLGTPVYPRKFFAALLHDVAGQCTILSLRLDNKPVSAAFLIRHRGTLEIPWAATIAAVKPRSVNMALYWEALRHAIENGCTTFDFGRSTLDSGPYRFKLQWGARPVPLHWIHRQPAKRTDTADISPNHRRARSLATRVWTHLPLRLANRLGPLISPSLPW